MYLSSFHQVHCLCVTQRSLPLFNTEIIIIAIKMTWLSYTEPITSSIKLLLCFKQRQCFRFRGLRLSCRVEWRCVRKFICAVECNRCETIRKWRFIDLIHRLSNCQHSLSSFTLELARPQLTQQRPVAAYWRRNCVRTLHTEKRGRIQLSYSCREQALLRGEERRAAQWQQTDAEANVCCSSPLSQQGPNWVLRPQWRVVTTCCFQHHFNYLLIWVNWLTGCPCLLSFCNSHQICIDLIYGLSEGPHNCSHDL